ncbi:MAG: methyltransferase [Dehalococcoidia bacterium]|nr:methyltransferase [Dehalococcoidia bacterium]
MTEPWLQYSVSADASHHVHQGRPAYAFRFDEVLKFHDPGLAPARDASGAYHIAPNGLPAYPERYVRTFGFYEGRAAVHSEEGWFHILADGTPIYPQRYAWCGNFQEGRCPVRLPNGAYAHLAADGSPAYAERYCYVGDFKDGHAVVQREDGKHTHIDSSGNLLHGRWFHDLDVFHKRLAQARDAIGWRHVDMSGEPLYQTHFKTVEPFYNGQARVEQFDGSLCVIDEAGRVLMELREPLASPVAVLSDKMVGAWRTQAIYAAVQLGVFEALPASAEEVERLTALHPSVGIRLMRALAELGLARRDGQGVYYPTELGALLTRSHPLSLADAARHWGEESYAAWAGLARSLQSDEPSFDSLHGKNFFDWLQDNPAELRAYHSAMAAYAKHDYARLADAADFGAASSILDAGGGTGELAFSLLRSCPQMEATVMDRKEVVETAIVPSDLGGRCWFVAGDLFQAWPAKSDAVILARVLHDWPEPDALRILWRARDAMPPGGALYLIELVLDDADGRGGLLDLNMLVMTRGAERTKEDFKRLLDQAGFALLDVQETGTVNSILRARAL